MDLIDSDEPRTLVIEPDLADYIEPDPHRPDPSDVRLRQYGIHVWVLVGYWLGTGRDACRTAQDYDIPMEYLEAALRYYERHKIFIDVRRAQNAYY